MTKIDLTQANATYLNRHELLFKQCQERLLDQGIDVDSVVKALQDFQVAIPSWALGAGGTRFGRFSIGGEPANLLEKIEDVGIIHQLTQCAGSISLHIPWDIPEDPEQVKQAAERAGITFDAVNSNTFQDQAGQTQSYQFGSLCHTKRSVREAAIKHNQEVISIGESLGSKALTVWLADGSSYPGQMDFRGALDRTEESLAEIYASLPDDWTMLIEYKPYEPYFYHMVIPDWGTSFLLANSLGPKATTLVDLGHHLPNTNIELIVATLLRAKKLGGFHFNDSKFGDDDLSVGSIKPYQLFHIFCELTKGLNYQVPEIAWMIDASHNLKDPLEDLIQSLDQIQNTLAKALCLDQAALARAQMENDVTHCSQIIQNTFMEDVRPLVAEARLRSGGAIHPIEVYRKLQIRQDRIERRGSLSRASGL